MEEEIKELKSRSSQNEGQQNSGTQSNFHYTRRGGGDRRGRGRGRGRGQYRGRYQESNSKSSTDLKEEQEGGQYEEVTCYRCGQTGHLHWDVASEQTIFEI